MKKALVIVDIQNDYFPGGKLELHASEAAGARAGALLAHFRDSRPSDRPHPAHLGAPGRQLLLARHRGRPDPSRRPRPAQTRPYPEELPERVPRHPAARSHLRQQCDSRSW